MGFVQEFMDFLKEYKVIGLAVAFIMATASTALVKSFVDDIVMPIISPFIPGGDWQTAVINIGPVAIKSGSFLSQIINFVILALVVFIIAKKVLKEEKVVKK
ncbi:MAG: MscL family protein [Candidatus Methanofastidiosum sp.]|nr:MscL family protein [Methanofastidiosum sp.]